MRQYDVCRNPDRATRQRVPFLVVLQSDLLVPLETVIVAPLVPEKASSMITKLNPAVVLQGRRYRLVMQELAGVPKNRLGEVVANAAAQHLDFIAAIDLLFTGI